jgi:hypothetical protein
MEMMVNIIYLRKQLLQCFKKFIQLTLLKKMFKKKKNLIKLLSKIFKINTKINNKVLFKNLNLSNSCNQIIKHLI